MQTKVIDKIVLSESAPSNKNVAWLKPSTEGGGGLSLKVYKDQEWSKVETTPPSDGDGGGTPINNQDKVVDITENGTTEVVADGGYTGLGKVTINTEVSGGGSDEWVYYDLRNQESKTIFSMIAQNIPHSLAAILEYSEPKLQYGTQYMNYNNNNPSNVGLGNMLGFGYLASHKLKVGDKEATGREFVALLAQQLGATDILESTPKITKEQFYSLD